MADKLTRAKDILKNNLSTYLETTTNSAYLTYFEGSPTYLIYYQLDNSATLQDGALETVHSLVGANTPNKYKKIYDLPVYGVDALDVQNELNERGLQANVDGEILILPDSVRPYPNDFFVFAYEGLENHLFRITDVQYDKLSPKKFFRCQYSLFQNNADEILNNVIEEYETQYNDNTDGSDNTIEIVKKSDAAAANQIESLVDGLIDKYTKLFYNDDIDAFVCDGGLDLSGTLINNNAGEAQDPHAYYYWSPYLQHFLHETKALTGFKNEIMTEIYINDINEIDNGNVYSEAAYRNSIFRSVETQDPDVTFDMNFFCVPEYDLKMTRNLPFFMSPLNYRLVTPIVKKSPNDFMCYMNSYPLFFGNTAKLFKDVDHYHKVHIMDDLHIARIEPYIKDRDIIYECNRHELEPTKICMAVQVTDSTDTYLEIQDISIERLFKEGESLNIEGLELFNIIKDHLNGKFVASEELLTKLNNLYYKPSIENYILIPLVLYILKENINK